MILWVCLVCLACSSGTPETLAAFDASLAPTFRAEREAAVRLEVVAGLRLKAKAAVAESQRKKAATGAACMFSQLSKKDVTE